jgi:hypothetical protein
VNSSMISSFHPLEVESASSGFDTPVLFFQTLLIHAWYAKRTPRSLGAGRRKKLMGRCNSLQFQQLITSGGTAQVAIPVGRSIFNERAIAVRKF